MVLEFDGQVLTARFLRPSGEADDIFTIDKSDPTTVRPLLQTRRSANGVLISWPTSTPEFALESTDRLPATAWGSVLQPILKKGRQNTVTIGTNSAKQLFRLRAVP